MYSRLQFDSQREVATWNQRRTIQIAHRMSADFICWLVQEANIGNWDGEELGGAFCQLDSDNKLKLATVEEELQQQLAVLNKTKVCFSVPLLGKSFQHWVYQEAIKGRWDQDIVFRVLEGPETDEGAVVSARVKHLGMYILKR